MRRIFSTRKKRDELIVRITLQRNVLNGAPYGDRTY